jgi:hypothetical protein
MRNGTVVHVVSDFSRVGWIHKLGEKVLLGRRHVQDRSNGGDEHLEREVGNQLIVRVQVEDDGTHVSHILMASGAYMEFD